MNRVVLAVCWVVGSSVACDPSPTLGASSHDRAPSSSAVAAAVTAAAEDDGGAPELVALAPQPAPISSARPAASADVPAAPPVVARMTALATPSPVAAAVHGPRVADPIDVPPPRPGAGSLPGTTTAGHICFSWRRGHSSSTQCYSSVESCNAERRAAPAAEELTRCQPRMRASCTVVETDLGRQRHCFGDAARCEAFRAELDPTERSTPCNAG